MSMVLCFLHQAFSWDLKGSKENYVNTKADTFQLVDPKGQLFPEQEVVLAQHDRLEVHAHVHRDEQAGERHRAVPGRCIHRQHTPQQAGVCRRVWTRSPGCSGECASG